MKTFPVNSGYKFLLSLIILNSHILGMNARLLCQTEKGHEYELKATFIYHFTRYIQWPHTEGSESFDIGILGQSEIVKHLEEIAKKKTVKNKKMAIKHLDHIEDIQDCEIVFVSASRGEDLDRILQNIGDKNILTISDTKGFAQRGIAINFIIEQGKMKFEINTRALERAGLVVSSQLQKLAILVDEEET